MEISSILPVMEGWSCEHLKEFLQRRGLYEVATAVLDNEVTGQCLLECTALEMKELAPKIGDRVKLRRIINENQVSLLNYTSPLSISYLGFILIE